MYSPLPSDAMESPFYTGRHGGYIVKKVLRQHPIVSISSKKGTKDGGFHRLCRFSVVDWVDKGRTPSISDRRINSQKKINHMEEAPCREDIDLIKCLSTSFPSLWEIGLQCNHGNDYYSSHTVSYIGCTGWEYNFSVILPFGIGGSLCILGTAYIGVIMAMITTVPILYHI